MGLFDFLNKVPKVNEINGSFGEWLATICSKIIPDSYLIHDVLIDGAEGFTSQIDLLIISNKGINVVEVKMFTNAKIYGNTDKSTWNYYSHGKKYEIYSPLKQNKKHIDYLKRFLCDFGEVPCFSIITMICEDIKISGEINKEDYLDTAFCTSIPAMHKAIKKITDDKPVVFDDGKMRAIYEFIKNNQYMGKDARQEHKQNVISYKEKLEESKKKKFCPYCKTELILRNGKNGEFYGCKNYPKCKYTTNV